MQNKVQRQAKFTSLAKRHTQCGLMDVQTDKHFKDFPINFPDWKLRDDANKKVM